MKHQIITLKLVCDLPGKFEASILNLIDGLILKCTY